MESFLLFQLKYLIHDSSLIVTLSKINHILHLFFLHNDIVIILVLISDFCHNIYTIIDVSKNCNLGYCPFSILTDHHQLMH